LLDTNAVSQLSSKESMWTLFNKIFGSKATSLVNKTRGRDRLSGREHRRVRSRVAQLRVSFLKRASFCRVHSMKQSVEHHHSTHSYFEISKKLNVNLRTAWKVLNRYENNRNRLISKRKNCGRRQTAKSVVIKDLIRSPQRLQHWALMTLKERCSLLQ
jgi:hypothetical protein